MGQKTFTILYNPNEEYDFSKQAWTQITIIPTDNMNLAELREAAHQEARYKGSKHGFDNHRLYDKKPRDFEKWYHKI